METPRHHVAEMLQLLLGNFLSGMETLALLASGQITAFTLETSLVEWKQIGGPDCYLRSRPLETSLVEWKRGWGVFIPRLRAALETSLVEWKLSGHILCDSLGSSLGNFLSGMETKDARRELHHRPALETSLVEWKRAI